MEGIKLTVDKVPFWTGNGTEIRITTHGQQGDMVLFNNRPIPAGQCCIGSEFTFKPIGDPCMIIPTAMTLNNQAAQQLIDGLWDSGFRPSNGDGSIGQLGATERHLTDMQQIAKHLLKMEK